MFALLSLVLCGSSTSSPTLSPTEAPTQTPTQTPTRTPTLSLAPTLTPTFAPTFTWEAIPQGDINLTCGFASVGYTQFAKMKPPIAFIFNTFQTTKYAAFYPNVDDFTLLEIQNSFNQSWLDDPSGNPVYIRAEVGGVSSPWRLRGGGSGTSRTAVPFWTLIVQATNGVVTALTWDDSCYTLCANQALCVSVNCGVAFNDCAGTTNCNFQVYLGWFGTDSAGIPCTSADKRISQFRSGSLMGAYNSALSKANDIVAIATPALG